jgi:FdhD protein
MGHLVAEKVNMTLLARCTGKHFLLVTGKERMIYEPHLLDSSLQVA